MNLIIGLSLAVVVLGNGILLGRAIERRKAPAPRAAFDVELNEHLRRNDYVLVTREIALSRYLGVDVRANPYLRPDQAVFVNPRLIEKLITDWPLTVRSTQEFGTRGARTSPFLTQCAHAWDDQRAEPHTIPVHECTLSVAIHGPKCVCRCGATAAYVEQPDGTIDKTFEEPKDDGS